MPRRPLFALAFVGLAACGDQMPTDLLSTAADLPRWEQTWVVPGDTIALSAADLMPTSVGLNADSTAFVATTASTALVLSLAEMCESCATADGTTVPKPEFQDTVQMTVSLPGNLVSASVTGGSLNAALAHNLSFDPLRPNTDPSSPRGYLVIRVTSDGTLMAFDSISGQDEAFPAGTTLVPDLPVQPAQVAGGMTVEIVVYSPQGDPVSIDASDTVGISLPPSTLEVSEATINASSVTIQPVTAATLDVSGVDSAMVERIRSGAFRLDVSNPLDVAGTLDMELLGTTLTVQKSLTVTQGAYQDRVDFTGEELRAILGGDAVDVVASGTVSAPGGTLTVTPSQRLVMDSDFELVILIGPTEEM